ncbi:MAG: stage III sporulation protein AG [Romboutsia sp.]
MLKNLNDKDKKKIYSLLSLAVICVIALVGLSVIPEDKSSKDEIAVAKDNEEVVLDQTQNELETKLVKILSQIDGAGDLDVMVTFESSEELHPAYNSNSTTETTEEKDAQGGERTVTTSSENKTMITGSTSNPIVTKTTEAKIKGVIVVSSGASDPKVKETLYSAVQTALQVSGHQVEIYSK